MKKHLTFLLWTGLIVGLIGFLFRPIPEPEMCSLCDDLSRHAPCILNLSTGEKLELEMYEPHPFLVGEIAKEQQGGYFSIIRGAGVEGFKLAAESVVAAIPTKTEQMNHRYFCNSCRELLTEHRNDGYVLIDLINPGKPVAYSINESTSISLRCYEIDVLVINRENSKSYQITVVGTLDTESNKSNGEGA